MTDSQKSIIQSNLAYIFKNWRDYEIAARTGIKLSTLRSIKSRGYLSVENAQKLADHCNMSIYELNPAAVTFTDVTVTIPISAKSKLKKFVKSLILARE